MSENYTNGVKKLLKYSKEESVRLSTTYVGSEHLLLAIILDVEGDANRLLSTIGCDLDKVKNQIEKEISTNNNPTSIGHLPLTRRLERILKKSYDLAKKDGLTIANQNYLLLALSYEQDGLAANILKSLSIDPKIISSFILTARNNNNEKDIGTSTNSRKKEDLTMGLNIFLQKVWSLRSLPKCL